MERLHWRKKFVYPKMMRLETPMDGSCLFHAVCLATNTPYQEAEEESKKRTKIVRELRLRLAWELGQPGCYDKLCHGRLRQYADELTPEKSHLHQALTWDQLLKTAHMKFDPPTHDAEEDHIPDYHLATMQAILSSHRSSVDNSYHEFISDKLKVDIYILLGTHKEVGLTVGDAELLIKGRTSIVLLYEEGHYELIGLRVSKSRVQIRFEPDHPFILAIGERRRYLLGEKPISR